MKIEILVVDDRTQYNFNGIMRLILQGATQQSISMTAREDRAFVYLVSFEGISGNALKTLTALVEEFKNHMWFVE